jgi:hypothetical protein
MKLLKKTSELGQVLVLALILLALSVSLVVPGLNLIATNVNYHRLMTSKTLESYSADSGLQYAFCMLYNDPGGYTSTPLQVNFNINNQTVSVTTNYTGDGIYQVNSRATGSDGRATTIRACINLSLGTFAYTVAAKTSLSIQDSTVNSTLAGGADIACNGNISLGSGGMMLINGNAYAVGTISNKSCVTGMAVEGCPPISFPGDYTGLYKTLAQEKGSYVGDVSISGGTADNPILLPGPSYPYAYIQGSLTIGTNSFVRLTNTAYVTGTPTMKPGSRLDGQCCICAEGAVQFNKGTVYSTLIPVIISKNSNITSTAQSSFCAVLYAPNGTVTLGGQGTLYGAVDGNTVSIGGSTVITYAAQLHGRQDLPGGELTPIAYSYQ